MAEAFLKRYGGDYFDVYSGGFDPQPLNPYAIKVMQEIGYDLSIQQPKDLWQLSKNEHFGIVITVCKMGEEPDCPTIAGPSTRLYWNIDDPAAFAGTEEQKLEKFRSVRNKIDELVKGFLKDRNVPIAE
jgi:arsenate reductase